MADKGVLITGAAGGIGSAITALFKASGWKTAGVDILDKQPGECDVFFNESIGDASAVDKISRELRLKSFPLKCVINNAALQVEKPLLETGLDEWNSVLAVNLTSIYLTTRALSDVLHGGCIINVSSVHARATSKGMAAYVASKGAVSSLTRALALELADSGIRVNSILPGAVDTEMLRKGLRRSDDPEGALKRLKATTPLQRVGHPEEVAQVALFLADPERAGFVTGQEFIVDGGVLARLASE